MVVGGEVGFCGNRRRGLGRFSNEDGAWVRGVVGGDPGTDSKRNPNCFGNETADGLQLF